MRVDGMTVQLPPRVVEVDNRRGEKLLSRCHRSGQDRLEYAGEQAERIQRQCADLLQLFAATVILRHQPRRLGRDVAVDHVRNGDESARYLGKLTGFVELLDAFVVRQQALPQRGFLGIEMIGQLAIEDLLHEAGSAAGDVYPLADQM